MKQSKKHEQSGSSAAPCPWCGVDSGQCDCERYLSGDRTVVVEREGLEGLDETNPAPEPIFTPNPVPCSHCGSSDRDLCGCNHRIPNVIDYGEFGNGMLSNHFRLALIPFDGVRKMYHLWSRVDVAPTAYHHGLFPATPGGELELIEAIRLRCEELGLKFCETTARRLLAEYRF